MNMHAPILITVLNRHDHFRRCVASLLACIDADKTDLHIAFDYPSKDAHWEGYNKIEQYIPTIKGFKSINVIRRDVNYGAERNVFGAFDDLFKTHDRLIVTEDDNEFSNNFLLYINKGLNLYNDRKDVFAVCGYNYPINMPHSYKANAYLWKGYSAWGCGIWKDKWNEISLNPDEINSFLINPKNAVQLERYSSHYMPALLQIINNNHMTADTFISMYLIENNMRCLFPSVSKVRNHGHDGSGLHGGIIESNIYRDQLMDTDSSFDFSVESKDLQENKDVISVLKKHFKVHKLRWLYTYYNYMKYLTIHYAKLKIGFVGSKNNR
ncbi:glycosyltransferase family protein [Flavobacterium xueshanense]|uniref:Glycosyl transferase family 2 n=1 Tax=Flavobacterium xueshanense TaxID=935223 RepID=A0A1I2CMM1_9FLAO|nr:hypothetical protein [Flavobacterium xueshanense]SFE69474.1 hypothetical protein SAMN04488131_103115 [Flavobacterium xueshanense]